MDACEVGQELEVTNAFVRTSNTATYVNDQFWQHNQWFDMEYFYYDEEDDGI